MITKGRRYVRRAKNCSVMYRLCLSDEGSVSGPSVESRGARVESVSNVASNDVIGGLVANVNEFTKKPFPSVKINTSFLELIHFDICEFNGILTQGGKRHFITFYDDYSQYLHVYLLRLKDEAFDAFNCIRLKLKINLIDASKFFARTGGEYLNHEIDTFCEENGIKHERTSPYTPQQNGLVEIKNRTNMVNCMLNQIGQPNNLWGEALLTACHVHNRITSCVIPTSPYELWKGIKPNLDYFKAWGYVAYYRTSDPKRAKLGARANKSIFIGYAHNSKAYRLLDIESVVVVESRDVEFFEDKFSKDEENSSHTTPTSTSREILPPPPIVEGPRRSTRDRIEKSFGDDFCCYFVKGTQKKLTREVIFTINLDDDPMTFTEAMMSRDAPLWKEAINDEMDSIMSNGTW
uniref:Integrase catalytic domain-containing protein n=1 Tax=Lactuca sativa TaxID=4236 RepID=A0A9R1V227_LACSA|nr:hypothetical protein LSAT_V11C700355990 [Lactuca sativa]